MPVTSREEIPPLYRDRGIDPATARLVLKFPRNIARRDATASMDLYDHLVVVDDAALTVLSRRPGGYDERVIAHDTICAIDYGTDLLDGWLTVHSAGEGHPSALTLSYVGTSQDVVERLVALLRSLYRSGPAPGAGTSSGATAGGPASLPPLEQRDLGDQDIALVTRQLAVLRAERTAVEDRQAVGIRRPAVESVPEHRDVACLQRRGGQDEHGCHGDERPGCGAEREHEWCTS